MSKLNRLISCDVLRQTMEIEDKQKQSKYSFGQDQQFGEAKLNCFLIETAFYNVEQLEIFNFNV